MAEYWPVALSVAPVTLRLPAYADPDTTPTMAADAAACVLALRARAGRAPANGWRPVPSLRYEDFPQDRAKPRIEVTAAAAALADGLSSQLG